jgi:sugar-specific transcriptional regulator TrmB
MLGYDYSLLGLESRDIRVYEALYKQENRSLRSLAHATGLNRGTVYDVIKNLTSFGIVSYTQVGKRRHYAAAEPEVFQALIRERRDKLQGLQGSVTEYAANLRSTKRHVPERHMAQSYEGNEGIAAILRDVLQTVSELDAKEYAVISSQQASSFIYNNFKSFTRQRIRMGIYVRVLSDIASSAKPALSDRIHLVESAEMMDGYCIMYGNKTALISLSDTNELSGIVISDPGIARMQRFIFDQLWHSVADKKT